MPRTPLGHFRRVKGWLTTPDGTRSSLYGAVSNYRLREAAVGLPSGAVADPTSGASPLAVDADTTAIAAVAMTGRGGWPRDTVASSDTARSGPAAGLTVAGTAYSRTTVPASPSVAAVSVFDWNDAGDIDSVAFDTTVSPAHTYTGAGTEQVDISTFDALGRETVEGSTTITVS